MRIEALDIVGLKATKELLQRRINENEHKINCIINEHQNYPYAHDDDWRGDEKRESERLISLYSKKLKMVEEQIEKKLIAIH